MLNSLFVFPLLSMNEMVGRDEPMVKTSSLAVIKERCSIKNIAVKIIIKEKIRIAIVRL